MVGEIERMTVDQLITDLIQREGGYVNLPADRGGPTKFGIAAATLGDWRGLGRAATAEEVRALTVEEARTIYARRYVQPFAAIPFDELRAHLVDIGVNSGVVTAIKMLQRVVGVTADGVLGERTRLAVSAYPWAMTNAALVAQRVKLYSDLADKDVTQRGFLRGWIRRAVLFLPAPDRTVDA